MRHNLRWLGVGMLSLFVAACGETKADPDVSVCGDFFCAEDETVDSCYADCGECGDGVCSAGEETLDSCPLDCAVCGDDLCSEGENATSCHSDCGSCGDGICTSENESVVSCAEDCVRCGDGICSEGEDAQSCYVDCGECGDGVCQHEETNESCAEDCHDPEEFCTAVYEIGAASTVSDTPFGAGNGIYELEPSTLTLRYQVDPGTADLMDGGRVRVLHYWIRNQVSVSNPAKVDTDVVTFAPTCNGLTDLDDATTKDLPAAFACSPVTTGEPIAYGHWEATNGSDSSIQNTVTWEYCLRARGYDKGAGKYVALPKGETETLEPDFDPNAAENSDLPKDSHGRGCLQNVRSIGNIVCGSLCSAGQLETGDNIQNSRHNQPWEQLVLSPDANSVELKSTRVPNGQPAKSSVSFTGTQISNSCL